MSYIKIVDQGIHSERKGYFKDKEYKILHREDGPAVEWKNGGKQWYINGKRHRIGAPAIEYSNGDKEWFVNGICHREDGPAAESASGKNKDYYLNGIFYTEENYWAKIKFGDFI